MAGRPSKLTPEVQTKIVKVLADGGHYVTAATVAGVEYTTFRNWMLRGAQAHSGQYFDFLNAVKAAEAQAEAEAVAAWKSAIPDSWQAARDFLARRFPERWSDKARVDVSFVKKEASRVATQYGLDEGEVLALAEEMAANEEREPA